ncbi:hypothetical protein I4U23_016137 [Adineta vaga]|nr:hypothetical protein I4U23_016137 [Adineta vaga]
MHSSTIISLIIVLVAIATKHSSVAIHDSYIQALRRRSDSYNYDENKRYNMLLRSVLEQINDNEDSDDDLQAVMQERADTDKTKPEIKAGIQRASTGGTFYNALNSLGTTKTYFPVSIRMSTSVVWGSTIVKSIQVTYEATDGTQITAPSIGINDPATACPVFNLARDERIIKVTGGAGSFIDWLQFTTNKGRTSNKCGGNGGGQFTEEYSGYALSYINGNAQTGLEGIRFYWYKIPAIREYRNEDVCSSQCQNGGQCTGPNNCTCTSKWTGPTCEQPKCFGCGCQNGGQCTGPDMHMYLQWTGPACTQPICSSECKNGGLCTAPNTCTCALEWNGPTCETRK